MSVEDYKWHYDYIRLAWDAGFSFEKYKLSNFDKNKICLVDIERIIKERDVASVERFLSTVVQYVLENDQAELLDINFVKMFRMSQLSVEYLLFCKKYLDNTVVLLKKELSKLKEENKELKLFAEELETHISALTKHSCVATFKCNKCPKAFSSEEYLNSHIKRRHSNEDKTATNVETDKLHSEIKQLKERLNIAEKLLQEKDEKVQNDTLHENENENKLKVNEILEKFEKFKDKVENDIKILQIEKNFYEEKYSKLFEVLLETSKKENISTEPEQEPQLVSRDKIQQQQNDFVVNVDKIETTTQTEKESRPIKNLQIETVHNKNIFEFKDEDKDSDSTHEKIDIQDTIEQKITQFEEQLELKISSGLTNIEKQMQAFWGKLSEIELKQEVRVVEGVQITSPHEFVQEIPKPKIKPRMKLSKPSKLMEKNEENAKKIKAEIEKMYVKPETTALSVKTVSESNLNKISNVIYDSSPSSESQKKNSSDSTSDSESSIVEVVPKKVYEIKPSVSTLGKRSLTSLKKAAQSKEVTEKLREEINNIINNRLQDIGISPNWNGIPPKTFEKALEIVRHQATIAKKSHPDFDSIKKSIETSLNNNKDIAQKMKNRTVLASTNKQSNVINIRYRKKPKELKSETDSKSVVTIKNRSLYNTDSDSEEPQRLVQHVKSPKKVSEAVPSYTAVIQELKASQTKNVDTDSDINSIILPKEDIGNETHTKSALKNYPSMGSLSKKKVLFDIESDKIEVEHLDAAQETRGSLTSIDSSDVIKEDDNETKVKKNGSSLSDFDLSEM